MADVTPNQYQLHVYRRAQKTMPEHLQPPPQRRVEFPYLRSVFHDPCMRPPFDHLIRRERHPWKRYEVHPYKWTATRDDNMEYRRPCYEVTCRGLVSFVTSAPVLRGHGSRADLVRYTVARATRSRVACWPCSLHRQS